jgi:sec-independent protein translocase protein TatA
MNLAAFGLERLGPGEIILILAVVVLLFGAKRIPELARSLGKSLSEFKKGQREGASRDAAEDDKDEKPEGKPPSA